MSRWIEKRIYKMVAPSITRQTLCVGGLCKAFYERYGEEALPIIAEVMAEDGVRWVKTAQRSIRGKGMKGIGEMLARA